MQVALFVKLPNVPGKSVRVNRYTGAVYNPNSIRMRAYREIIKQQIKQKYPHLETYDGAVSITCRYYFFTKDKKKLKQFHEQKPDVDNLQKFTYDVLKGIVFSDDRKIVHADIRKGWWTHDGMYFCVQFLDKNQEAILPALSDFEEGI